MIFAPRSGRKQHTKQEWQNWKAENYYTAESLEDVYAKRISAVDKGTEYLTACSTVAGKTQQSIAEMMKNPYDKPIGFK